MLKAQGFEPDAAAPGRAASRAQYEHDALRSQPFDCPVGAAARRLPGHALRPGRAATPTATSATWRATARRCTPTGRSGCETLWDLRARLIAEHGAADGVNRARGADHRRAAAGARPNPTLPRHAQRDPPGGREPRLRRPRPRSGRCSPARGMGSSPARPATRPHPGGGLHRPPPLAVPDRTAPAISRFSMSRRASAWAAAHPRTAGTPRGTAFPLPALGGRVDAPSRSTAPCRPARGQELRKPSRRLRKRPRCTRYVRRGT